MVKSNGANNLINSLVNQLVTIIQFLTPQKNLANAWVKFRQNIKVVPINYHKLLREAQHIKMVYLDSSLMNKQNRPSNPSLQKFTSPIIKNQNNLLQENEKTIKTKFDVKQKFEETFTQQKLKNFLQRITSKKIVLDDSIKHTLILKSQYNIKSLIEILSLGFLKQLYKNKKYQLLQEICTAFKNQQYISSLNKKESIFSIIRQKLQQLLKQTKKNTQINQIFLKFGYSLEIINNLAMVIFTFLINKLKNQFKLEIKSQQQLQIIKIFYFYLPIKILRFKQNTLRRQEYIINASDNLSPIFILCVQINDIKDYYILQELSKFKQPAIQIKSDKRKQNYISNPKEQNKKNTSTSSKKEISSQKRYICNPYNMLLQQKQNKIAINSKISKKTKQLLLNLNKSMEQINKLAINIKPPNLEKPSSLHTIKTFNHTPEQQSMPLVQIDLKYLSE